MGDRCYMQVTCRRQDQDRFKELGFHGEDDTPNSTPLVELIDEEANYAHYDALPRDIPYHGFHGVGDNYGSHNLACDGKRYADVETGHDGDYVILWNSQTNRPSAESLRRIRTYLAVLERSRQQLTSG